MLTKQDQKFLLDNFASKKDVKMLESKIEGVDTRVATVKKKVDELTEFVVPTIGNILEWTDDIHKAIIGHTSKRSHGN